MYEKNLFIKDLTVGDSLEDFVVGIADSKELKDKNGNTYFDITLVDNSGNLKAKIWSDRLERIERIALSSGNLVRISGSVSEYRGELQLTIHELYLLDKLDYEIGDFTIAAPRPVDEMWDDLLNYVEKVKDTDIKIIIDNCLDKYEDEIKEAAAAERLHHAYTGGLLQHILEILDMMEPMKKHYPEANYDYVIAGAIFHDIGKIQELSIDGFAIKRTTPGKLIGHLVLSYKLLLDCVHDKCSAEVALKLEHLVLSHHGILEYGSPVMPKTLEAIIFHKLDDISGNVRQYKRVLDESDDDADFSRRDWAIGTDIYLK